MDTGGWVALFVDSDENHRKALRAFQELKKSKALLYTSDYVVDETMNTIRVRGNHKQSVVAGEALLKSKVVTLVRVFPEYFEESWRLYQKYTDKELSFTDATSLTIMKNLGIHKVFTFDHEFEQVGLELIGP